MKKLVIVGTIALSVLASGCSTRIADMTVASTKNVNMNSSEFVTGNRITGSDTVPVIIFPLGNPDVKEAIDVAIEHDKCVVALNDVVIEQSFFVFVFGFISFDVEGTQIIDKSVKGCENWEPQVVTVKEVSQRSRS